MYGICVGKVGFEPTFLIVQELNLTEVTHIFTIVSEENQQSVFELLPHIIF